MPLGSVGGAIQYQAPETLAGSLAGSSALTAHPSADIYALGIMWYEMLTGHHPFENATLGIVYKEDPRAYLRAHYQMRQWESRPARFAAGFNEEERIVPASEINEELRHHPQLEAMLNRCLSARQSDRYQNARLLLNELDRYVETGAVSTGTGAIEPATDKKNAQAISLPTKTPEMLVKDAESLLKQGQHGAAIEKADEALKNKPRLISAMLIKARVLIAMKRIEEATACLNSASEEGGENPDLCAALAEFYTAINKPSAAADYRLMEQQLRKKQGQQSRR
jgi:serine/threonine protein kinase